MWCMWDGGEVYVVCVCVHHNCVRGGNVASEEAYRVVGKMEAEY